MKPDAGESTAAIRRHEDDRAWPQVEVAMRAGATLYRPPKLDRYYIDFGEGPAGGIGSLSPARVRKLEGEGVLEAVGEYRYALARRVVT